MALAVMTRALAVMTLYSSSSSVSLSKRFFFTGGSSSSSFLGITRLRSPPSALSHLAALGASRIIPTRCMVLRPGGDSSYSPLNSRSSGGSGFSDRLPTKLIASNEGLPGVLFVRPDSYVDVETKGYGGTTHANLVLSTTIIQQLGHHPMCFSVVGSCYSSEANKESARPTEIVDELYQKMFNSVEARTMPPNAWVWSLVENCSNREDIRLLFQILHKLRVFRLSNLRIHENFNSHLCMRVSEACARADALDYGMKALWKHNVYGLTPSVGSAHYLLLHAKKHNDIKLMVKIMQVLKKNSLPLQPGTADIVFSICYNTNNWDLISKYSKRFLKAGVKLHRTAFDIWMEFAAKIGDAQSIWKIEKIRSNSVKTHTLASGFSCAKGYLIECNPESAAAIIHRLYQDLPDPKKPYIADELQKLISQWPVEMLMRQKNEYKEGVAESLRSSITVMAASLLNMGMDVKVNMEELKCC